jgi:hypothetical protein
MMLSSTSPTLTEAVSPSGSGPVTSQPAGISPGTSTVTA